MPSSLDSQMVPRLIELVWRLVMCYLPSLAPGLTRVAPVPLRLNGAFISQHVAILRLKEGLLPEFLSMFLSLDAGGQREIARLQYGQTKPGLNLDQIREFRVPVPPVSRQQRFLKLAERVDRLRAVQREALRQAEHLFQSLLDKAFSKSAQLRSNNIGSRGPPRGLIAP